MTFTATDEQLMTRALQLAERGRFTTAPNPAVGCVIAHDEKIVGEGWHEKAGEPHAEVHALRQAGNHATGATAYVTLEPCAHQGRTGPCAQALIAAGVKKVIAATLDPNPLVSGNGIAQLRAAGVECHVGLMVNEARELMRGFLSRMTRQRPFVTLKLAASMDGRVALSSGESRWITGALARADVQRLRARNQAIITGSGTVLSDNPRLTVRRDDIQLPAHLTFEALSQPLRVVLDSRGQVGAAHAICDGAAATLLVVAGNYGAVPNTEKAVLPNASGHIDLGALLRLLAQRGINDALVECGPRLAGAFIAAGLVDELVLYQAPCWLGAQGRSLLQLDSPATMAQVQRWQTMDVKPLGPDWRVRLRPLS